MRGPVLHRSGAFAIASLLAAAAFPAAENRVPPWVEEMVLVDQQPETRGPGRIRFEPNRETVDRLQRSRGVRLVGFPLPGGAWVDLEVVSTDIVHSGTRFVVAGPDGAHETAGPSARLFRGTVAGDPGSLVSLNLIDGHLAGFVRTGGSEYSFGPRSFARDESMSRRVNVVDAAQETGPSGACDGEEYSLHDATRDDLGALRRDKAPISFDLAPGTPLIASVAVEGTVEWVARHGGVAAATAYTLNLMAQVSAIYENDVAVQIQVPYVLMNAAESDGYSGASNNTGTLLPEMVAKWNGNASLRGVFRSAVHLLSTYPSGGAGRAYLDVLCDGVPPNASSHDFGVSLLQGSGGSWERRLVAHELGHNFSSPHTHCYVPEIDRCANTEPGCYSGPVVQTTGTVMSYCSSSTSVFHPRVIDEALRPGAEAAYPSCMAVAGSPGALSGSGAGALVLRAATGCPAQSLVNDDGGRNSSSGYTGTAQATWVKRLTPACHPFSLTGVQAQFGHSSVAPGRPVRLLVYTDTSGSGSPAAATLAHSQDVFVQATGGQWNSFTLSVPVVLGSGDYYVGFYDLLTDTATTYIMDYDSSRAGDSWLQAGGTDAGDFAPFTTGTWMIRAQGGGVTPGSLVLSWGAPCNDAAVPNQDYAIYQGTLGAWTTLTSLTCTTGGSRSWIIDAAGPNLFWLVVPQTAASEGSYGVSSFGERPQAAFPCRPQSIGACQQ